jgi:ribosome-binding ATPase YchF (GTP1/OBG family)
LHLCISKQLQTFVAHPWRQWLQDVAGLVPGAYKGRGRGNAFLNDLCDADVLVHVVDASGSTAR